MSFYDRMIERFETPWGVLGYDRDGRLIADRYPDVDRGFCPVWDGIWAIQDPSDFAILYHRAVSGDRSVVGQSNGLNDAGLEITATGVHAEVNVGMETYEQEMTFEEFRPILEAWDKAWAALRAYKGQAVTE